MSFSAEEDWRQKKSPKTRRRKWGWQGSRPGSASTETIQSVCCCQSTSDSHTLQIPNIMIHFCSLTLGNNILDISFTSNNTATNCRESKVQNWCRSHVKPPKPNQTGKKNRSLSYCQTQLSEPFQDKTTSGGCNRQANQPTNKHVTKI